MRSRQRVDALALSAFIDRLLYVPTAAMRIALFLLNSTDFHTASA